MAPRGCIFGLGWRLTTGQQELETHSPGIARNSSPSCSKPWQSCRVAWSRWHRLGETRRFQQAPFFGDISSVSGRGSNLFPPPLSLRTEATQGTAYVVLQQSHRLRLLPLLPKSIPRTPPPSALRGGPTKSRNTNIYIHMDVRVAHTRVCCVFPANTCQRLFKPCFMLKCHPARIHYIPFIN